jgi:hypothetical protein
MCLPILACGRVDRPPAESAAASVTTPAERALQVSDSVSLWFTSARVDTSADGKECRERVMEIRIRDRTVPVPLLYTGEVPALATDSTVHVHVWRHCVPADLYRVNLKTGQPTRVNG